MKLKATEIAEILNISRAYAYQLMQRGEIRTVQIGAARRVRPRDLREYIEENVYPPIELPLRYVVGKRKDDENLSVVTIGEPYDKAANHQS